MHKLKIAGLYTLATVVSFALSWSATNADASDPSKTARAAVVSVLYAGSLVTPMEGPIKTALLAARLDFQGEPGGSQALANLIAAGVRSPDVFVCVDPQLVTKLGSRVASAATFAGTSLGIAWAPDSKFASALNAAASGKISLASVLERPAIRIARTDPQLDPKGAYTVQGVTMWLGRDGERRLLGNDENPSQIFPEQDLLARVETGQADVGFFYHTEAIARGYRFIPLPGAAALTNRIAYTLAVMNAAPHPQQAREFETFILKGPGRAILERAGLTYF